MVAKTRRRKKYSNKKTIIDGISFDSRLEAHYYEQLKEDKAAGLITNFELQPVFVLIEPFTNQGKKFRKTEYRADFKVITKSGEIEILDTKGIQTAEFKIKRKLLESLYPGIVFYMVDRKGGDWRKFR